MSQSASTYWSAHYRKRNLMLIAICHRGELKTKWIRDGLKMKMSKKERKRELDSLREAN